eukprot:1149509-Pelagomonas_calceolata.AAC.1
MRTAGPDWRSGQPPNWRIDNEWLPSESDVASDLDERYPHLTQPHLPRECRCVRKQQCKSLT